MGTTVKLADVAKAVRSKNAKSFHLTVDIFFEDPLVYQRVKASGIITKELISGLYKGLEVEEFVWFDPGCAVKATFRRPLPVGSPGDTDVFGCQQHAPLYAIELPAELIAGTAR
jgi:hypothetical protein